jgi:hypothetical protein
MYNRRLEVCDNRKTLQEVEVSAREVPDIYNGVPGAANSPADMRDGGRALPSATGEEVDAT